MVARNKQEAAYRRFRQTVETLHVWWFTSSGVACGKVRTTGHRLWGRTNKLWGNLEHDFISKNLNQNVSKNALL